MPRFHRLPVRTRLLVCASLFCLAGCLWAAAAQASPSLSWSAPLEVDHGQSLSGVSCPSLGLCVAVDGAGQAVVSSRPAAAEAGSWSVPFKLTGATALQAISCPTTSLCVAIDSEGRAFVSVTPATASASAWSAAFALPASGTVSSLSCPSVSLCVAVDSSGQVLDSTEPARAAPGAWSASTLSGVTALTGVSCAAANLCAAVDSEGDVAVSTEPAGGASGWHARAVDPSEGLAAVSCLGPETCAAVDEAGDVLASSDAAAAITSAAGAGSGATWSNTLIDLAGPPAAVSCSAAGLCVIADGAGYAFASDGPAAAPPSWPATQIDKTTGLDDLSCVAEGLCLAVDGTGRIVRGLLPAPAATTGAALQVTHTSALLNGVAEPHDASLSGCSFEYGTTTAYGSKLPCAGLSASGGPQQLSATLAGLTANTTYHYRIVVGDALGSAAGADVTFHTPAPALVEPHPAISGTPALGQKLTCAPGVSGSPALVYSWLRNTTVIAGAAASTYTVAAADVSTHLQCRVTATTAEGSDTATSTFVTVPAGGVGTVVETTVGTARAVGSKVQVPIRCSPSAAGRCTIKLTLSVLESLRSGRVVGVAAAATRHRTVKVGTSTIHASPNQQLTATVGLNAGGRHLLASRKRLPVALAVTGTVVGVINAKLASASLTLPGAASGARRAAGARSARARPASSASKRAFVAFSTPSRAGVRSVRAKRHRARLAGGATPSSVLAPTPYMGWDTYFTFGGHFDEASVLLQASQLSAKGLEAEGYRYIWLDVGWWHGTRDASGQITVSSSQWPHGLAWLTATLHEAGFKVGLYTDAGREGCGGTGQGSYGHYQQDVNTFAAWGFDAVKVDFCGGVRLGLKPEEAYSAFHQAIVENSSHRPMLLSICDYLQPGQFESEVPTLENSAFDSYTFGPSSGNSWRTDTDVGRPGNVQFASVLRNLDADAAEPQAAGPGHWNDPDYLGPGQGMSNAQFRSQFSMWAMLAAPLMVSADMISVSKATMSTIANREAVAIDQDPAGLQARLLSSGGEGQVWVKPLADGERAVALLNRGSKALTISTTAAAVGLPAASGYLIHNVWSGGPSRIGSGGQISFSVPAYSTDLLRVAVG